MRNLLTQFDQASMGNILERTKALIHKFHSPK